MIARAAAMRPKLRAQQDENDERGTYSEELHKDFIKAGFYRFTQPRMFGGYEFDLTTFYKIMIEIARGHPGVGWCLASPLRTPSRSRRIGRSRRRSSCSARTDISSRHIVRRRWARSRPSTADI